MGKKQKQKQQQQRGGSRRGGAFSYYTHEEGDGSYEPDYGYPPSQPSSSSSDQEEPENSDQEEKEEEEKEDEENEEYPLTDMPSKFLLYQQSVQSPKGDISYLQKFFLVYVGGRQPLHLQEDFCGTALLSTEWLRSDSRRTAVGLDLDLDALEWCMENNVNKMGTDGYSRISLFHGNVLQPLEAKLVGCGLQELVGKVSLKGSDDISSAPTEDCRNRKISSLPARDIVCAFNYSCCCLHKRSDLVSYFKHVLDALSEKGGIFVMDLYGGTSSEQKLRLQRRFPNFTYVWEQAEFDIIQRKTRISLHYHLRKQQRKLRHAFSYSWRLWSLPEIKDCLEEAGFESVHFWLRAMPDANEMRSTEGFGAARDFKYEEVESFQQQDAWNAYVVAVSK